MSNPIYDPIEVDSDYFVDHPDEQDTLYKKINTLPGVVIDILFGEDTPLIIEQILRPYVLASWQCTEISRLIRKTLVGELPMMALAPELRTLAGLDPVNSQRIAQEISQKLLMPAVINNNSAPSTPTNPSNVLDLRNQNNT